MIGVVYPFSITNGGVSTTTDPAEISRSRIVFCLSTQVLERVMRPSWGIELMNASMAMGAEIDEIVSDGVEEAFRSWFPQYVLKDVRVTSQDHTTVNFDVRYGTSDSDADMSVRVGVPVPGGSEIFPSEGAF